MIVFFDTSVHIDILRGALTPDDVLGRVGGGPVRMSPVVGSELLRGSSGRARRHVEKLLASLVPIEPPSWRNAFLEAGRHLPAIFRHHEAVGLARLQNDVLLALTAHHTGAVLVTRDGHFSALAKKIAFRKLLIE